MYTNITMTRNRNYNEFHDIEDSILLITINKTYRNNMTTNEILAVTSRWWKLDDKRKDGAKYAIAVYRNEVKGVFTILSWNKREEKPKRWGFKGEKAPNNIHDKYINMSVGQYKKKGNSAPVMYMNC